MEPITRRNLIAGLIALGLALAMGGVSAILSIVSVMSPDDRYTPGHALIMYTPFWVFWALLFPLVLAVGLRYPLQRGTLGRRVPLHLLLAAGIAVLHFTITILFLGVIGHATWAEAGHNLGEHYFVSLRSQIGAHFVTYVVLFAGVQGWANYRLYRERELVASQLAAQLSQARLQALRMQLNPHFLFNAMNSISMLVRRADNTKAVKMLAGLSDLLRYVLEDSVTDEVSLNEELDFLRRYLEIEQVRFQDRLSVRFDIAEDTLTALVPNLLLQPLVENAIRHGIGRKINPGTVEVAARKLGDRLILQVSDDGPGLSGPVASGTGVGITNTRARLEQMYERATSFELRAGSSGGAVATVSLPFHTQPLRAEISAA